MSVQKKVAIVVDTLHGGGAEKVCILLAKAFARKGVDAHLIVVKPLCEYTVGADLQVHFLLDDANAKLYKNHVQSEAAARLKQLIKDTGEFDLVLSNLDGAHPVVSAAKLANTWYVVHNSIEEKLRRAMRMGPLKYFRQRKIYQFFKGQNLVAVSRGLQEELLHESWIKPKNVKLIYNPIDEEAINLSLQQNTSTLDEPYILHVGRFARLKRHDILFSAYGHLKTTSGRHPKLVLLCEGSRKLNKLIKRYGLEQNVFVAGFQQNPYIWMKNAEVLVLSSEGEGFGLVLVEAMLCGVPVVSTNCRHGPAEILSNNLSEYLSPVGDAVKLAENIDKAMHLKPLMNSAPILEKLKADYVVDQYLDLMNIGQDNTNEPV